MKDKKEKTITARISEIKLIYEKLQNLGLDSEVCPGIKEFKEVANSFVKEGVSLSGKIKLPEIERTLVYTLTMQSHIDSNVVLKNNNKT